MAEAKTNAMRMLERAKISYRVHVYGHADGKIDGVSVAEKLGQDVDAVYKTLVTRGASGGNFVFVIPVAKELDLKKAAKAAHDKKIELIHVKDLLAVTGYIRGGCTALGMKKQFPTVVDQSVRDKDVIYVSGGRRGLQLALAPGDLVRAAGAAWGDVSCLG